MDNSGLSIGELKMNVHKKVQESAKSNYNNSSPWPQNDAWHSYTYQTIQNYVQHTLDSLKLSDKKIILNAGCGLTSYKTPATILYMDIVEKYVMHFKNHLPFYICVSSSLTPAKCTKGNCMTI